MKIHFLKNISVYLVFVFNMVRRNFDFEEEKINVKF
jgi:hypothetical protein